MKMLTIVILSSIVASCLTYLGLTFLLKESSEISLGVASLPLMSMHHVCELLEKHRLRTAIKDKKPETNKPPVQLPSLEGFAIPWGRMLLFATALYFGVPNITSFIAGVLAGGVSDGDQATTSGMFLMINLPMAVIGAFLIGKWVGVRSDGNGLWVMLVAIALGCSAMHLFDYIFLPADEYLQVLSRSRFHRCSVFGGGGGRNWCGISIICWGSCRPTRARRL
jgi:hypothetical protein